jgi:hypothetical protein
MEPPTQIYLRHTMPEITDEDSEFMRRTNYFRYFLGKYLWIDQYTTNVSWTLHIATQKKLNDKIYVFYSTQINPD